MRGVYVHLTGDTACAHAGPVTLDPFHRFYRAVRSHVVTGAYVRAIVEKHALEEALRQRAVESERDRQLRKLAERLAARRATG